jgi:hypothetical protein
VTDPSALPVAGALVVAVTKGKSILARIDDTDASGNYALDLAATGEYHLSIVAPDGSTYHDADYTATCSGTQDHQFAVGLEVFGRVVDGSSNGIENAYVVASGESDFSAETLSDASGNFSLRVPADTYDLLAEGPVGGRYISELRAELIIDSDTDVGDLVLATGVLVSGSLLYRDDDARGPAMSAHVLEYDSDDEFVGSTTSIADGSFYLPSLDGDTFVLTIVGETRDLGDLSVASVPIAGDTDLDYPLTLHSSGAQLPDTPILIATDDLSAQVDQPIVFDAVHVQGSTAELLFPDGAGGWIEGIDTLVEQDRGVVVTKVPPLAQSGEVVLRIDGVDSPGYPLTIESGTFDPGPYTTTGIVSDGTGPVEDVVVAMLFVDCYEDYLIAYDMTAADGSYSVAHRTGPHFMLFLPPVASGLAAAYRERPDLTGDDTLDVTLEPGHLVTARCVDSGIGPVGGSGPLADCYAVAEDPNVDSEEDSLSRDDGQLRFNLPTGLYELWVEPPFHSRFVPDDGTVESITEDTDFGDIGLDSAYLLQGRVVDPDGHGLAGVEIGAWSAGGWNEEGYGVTTGSDGAFLLALPDGAYDLYFEAHDDHLFFVPPVFGLEIYGDTALHPAIVAEGVGAIEGAVTASGGGAVGEVEVYAQHEVYGTVDAGPSCEDGSYSLRAPTGDFRVYAAPSEGGFCYADEAYDNHYAGCGADLVTVTAPVATTGIDFALDPAGSVSGLVTDDWGAGVAGATVCAIAQASMGFCAEPCTVSSEDGSYVIRGVPVGDDYAVQSWAADVPTECWDDHLNCGDYDPVSVAECLDTPDIDFLMSGAPGPVPDGHHTPGQMMTVEYDEVNEMLIIHWQPTCSADNHAAYFGPIGEFYNYTSAECVMGATGNQPVDAPPGNVFFVVAGASVDRVGSFGVDSTLAERPSAGGTLCGYTQDLSAGCIP